MLTLASIFLASVAILLAVPVATFLIEVVAAIVLRDKDYSVSHTDGRHRVAVIVPAHNESTGILATLTDVRTQLGVGDRLLVVADNCSDDTAAVAAGAGAEVVERNELDRRGKGYALAWGISYLDRDPPDVVIIVDADCRLPDHAVEKLTIACAATNRPVQSLSSMISHADSPINTRVSEFAWLVKNYVRPRGLCNLGLPCQLMGAGMAFPWKVIRAADVASGSIVEDLKLGLDLAMAGHPPVFCPFPGVISEFPYTVDGLLNQRRRWEQGHIRTILAESPRLLLAATARANLDLLALALDLVVPPLSLLTMLLTGMLVLSSLATLFLGLSSIAMLISLAALATFLSAGLISWFRFGRAIIPASSIVLIVPYFFNKVFIYSNMLSGKSGSDWTRADRTKM